MGHTLLRNLGSPANLKSGEFALDAGVTHISCPMCSTLTVLNDDVYTIHPSGKVTPAWVCPACPFMDWLELQPEFS